MKQTERSGAASCTQHCGPSAEHLPDTISVSSQVPGSRFSHPPRFLANFTQEPALSLVDYKPLGRVEASPHRCASQWQYLAYIRYWINTGPMNEWAVLSVKRVNVEGHLSHVSFTDLTSLTPHDALIYTYTGDPSQSNLWSTSKNGHKRSVVLKGGFCLKSKWVGTVKQHLFCKRILEMEF